MTHYAPLVTLLTMLLALTLILLIGRRAVVHDIPNEHSLHDKPAPRVGDLGVMACISAGWMLLSLARGWWVMLLPLLVVSLLDDMHALPVRLRLSAHLVAAALVASASELFAHYGRGEPGAALLFTGWTTNLYKLGSKT